MGKAPHESRSYSMLVFNRDKKIDTQLSLTWDIMNKGAGYWLNFWLDFLGGFEPQYLASSPMNSFVHKPKPKKNKKGEEIEVEQVDLPASLILFTCWFSAESKSAPKEFVISHKKVLPTFLKYMSAAGAKVDEDWLPVLEKQIAAVADESVWVDRRLSFAHRKQITGIQSTKEVFCNPEFFLKQNGGNSNKYVRSLLSTWFGGGKKSEWENMVEILAPYTDESWLNSSNIYDQVIRNLSGERAIRKPGPPGENSLTTQIGVSNLSEKLGFPKAFSPENAKNLFDAICKEHKNALRKMGVVMPEWAPAVMAHMEKEVGLSYRPGKRNLQDHFGEMMCMAIQRLRSSKTWFMLRLAERRRHQQSDVFEHKEFAAWVDEFRNSRGNSNQDYITQRQFNGWRFIFDDWDGKSPLTDWVKQTKGECDSRFGDINLFTFLAQKMDAYGQCDWAQVVEKYMDWEYHRYKFSKMKTPAVKHMADAPAPPSFGESRPEFSIADVKEYKPGESIHHVFMELFNGSDFEKVMVPVVGKRLVNEVLLRTGTVEAARNSPMMRRVFGDNIKPVAVVKGARLMRGDAWKGSGVQRWHLAISVELPVQVIDKATFDMPPGTKVMSVDVGAREAAACALWTVSDKNHGIGSYYKNGAMFCRTATKNDTSRWVQLNETWFLREKQKTASNTYICRLSSSEGEPLTDSDNAFWNMLRAEGIVDNDPVFRDEPVKHVAGFNRRVVSSVIGHYRGQLRDKKPLTPGLLLATVNQVLTNAERRRVNMGGLSYNRIKMLQDLKKLCCIYLSVVDGQPPRPQAEEIEALDKMLDKKLFRVRMERVRVTASLIVANALQRGASVIVLEDLSLQSSAISVKFLNKLIDTWCPKRVLQEVKMQAKLFGILVLSVHAYKTSYTDFATQKEGVRRRKIRARHLLTSYWEKVLRKHHTRKPKGDRDVLICGAWQQIAKERGLRTIIDLLDYAKKHGEEEILVPDVCGEMFVGACGPVNADTNAACNVGLRGVRFALECSERANAKKKEAEKNSKTP